MEFVLSQTQRIQGAKHQSTALAMDNLGSALHSIGRHAEAERLVREAREIFRNTIGDKHHSYATATGNLSTLLLDTGREKEAEPLIREAMQIYYEVFGANHHTVVNAHHALAKFYFRTGQAGLARQEWNNGLQILALSLECNHPDIAEFQRGIAFELLRAGKTKQAFHEMKQALEKLVCFASSTSNLPRDTVDCMEAFSSLFVAAGHRIENVHGELSAICLKHRISKPIAEKVMAILKQTLEQREGKDPEDSFEQLVRSKLSNLRKKKRPR
jgi:hypothetical protein